MKIGQPLFMSHLSVESKFDQCCGSTTTSTEAQPTANINLYYDVTISSSPTIIPPVPSLPAVCFELNGDGPLYVWSPSTATWSAN
jgi:hypothetical protein